MRNPALDTWGDYDRDNPYPLFAQIQADGPVHQVTLSDGHRAWLIVSHAEAKAALRHAGLSKDMHAALARDGAVAAGGLPGPAFARHMLSADPPDHTRLRRLTSAAFSRPRIAALRPRVQAIADRLLDDLQARGDTAVDLVKGFAFPLPFTVISELLGIPEPDQDHLGNWFTTLLAPSSAPQPPAQAVAASANVVEYLTGLLARKRAAPGEDSHHRPGTRSRSRRRAVRAGDALHDLPADRRRAPHHNQPDRQRNRRPAAPPRTARRTHRRPGPAAARDRGNPALGRTSPALHVQVHHPGRHPRRHRHPSLQPGDHLAGRRQPGPRPLRQPGDSRHHPGRHQPPGLRPRHPPLPRRPASPARRRDNAHHPARPLPRHAASHPTTGTALEPRRRTRPARPDRTAGHPQPESEPRRSRPSPSGTPSRRT